MVFLNGMWHEDHLWSAHRLIGGLDRGVCSWGAAETVIKKQFASSLTLSHHLHSLTCQTHWCISPLKLVFLHISALISIISFCRTYRWKGCVNDLHLCLSHSAALVEHRAAVLMRYPPKVLQCTEVATQEVISATLGRARLLAHGRCLDV